MNTLNINKKQLKNIFAVANNGTKRDGTMGGTLGQRVITVIKKIKKTKKKKDITVNFRVLPSGRS